MCRRLWAKAPTTREGPHGYAVVRDSLTEEDLELRYPPSWNAIVLSGLVLFLAYGPGCSSAETVRTFPMLSEQLPPTAIVLLPAEIHFRGMRAHHYYDFWVDFAERLARSTGLPVIGPDEFTLRTEGPISDPMRDTDAHRRLDALGIRSENALAIRILLVESWQQGESMMADDRSESFRGGQFESQVEYSAEILHFVTGRPLIQMTSVLHIDGLPSPSDSDPRPDITALFRARSARVVELLAERCQVPLLPAGQDSPHARLHEGPQGSARQRYQDLPSVVDQTARADDVDREVALLARIAFRDPNLPREVERMLLKLPVDTLYVQTAADCTGLLPGDQLTQVEGYPASHAFLVSRAEMLARAAARPLGLIVTRAGQSGLSVSWKCW